MQYFKCINKIRDNSGVITHYQLLNSNGKIFTVDKDDLKEKILDKEIEVINLKMDSQGRLIDCKESKKYKDKQEDDDYDEDISNEDIKKLIESLVLDTKDTDKRIIAILSKLYNQNVAMSQKLDELTSSSNNNIRAVDKMAESLEYVLNHYKNVDDLEKDLAGLVGRFKESSKESDSNYVCPIHSDGIWSSSGDAYEDGLRNNYYSSGVNKLCTAKSEEEFRTELGRIERELFDNGFRYHIPTNISAQLIKLLKSCTDRKAKAYYQAKQFFTNQIQDYQSALNDTKLLSLLDSCRETAIELGDTEKFNGSNYIIPALEAVGKLPGVIAEGAVAIGRGLPFKSISTKADAADFKQKYRGKKTTMAEKLRLAGTGECIWNTYKKEWANDPDYDIKSYCIQSLGKLYLGERMLFIKVVGLDTVYEYYKENIFNYKIKRMEIEEEIYECAVISFFAALEALQILYETTLVRDYTTPAINGRIIALMRISMLMCNIKPEITEKYVGMVIDRLSKHKFIKVELDVTLNLRKKSK